MSTMFPRCTNFAAAALGVIVERPLMSGTCLLGALRTAGWTFNPGATFAPANGTRTTVRKFVAEHPTGVWYLSTNRHAMMLVDGVLHDYAGRGADGRSVQAAINLTKEA